MYFYVYNCCSAPPPPIYIMELLKICFCNLMTTCAVNQTINDFYRNLGGIWPTFNANNSTNNRKPLAPLFDKLLTKKICALHNVLTAKAVFYKTNTVSVVNKIEISN